MHPFVAFMVSPAGRALRSVAGLALIAWGLLALSGTAGVVVAIIGAVPLLAGLLDLCLFAPLFGGSIVGARNRAAR